jgi:signal transduction histidine kinase
VTTRRLVDIGLPLVLAVIATAELATNEEVEGPTGAGVAFALLTTLPLIWRRRAPVALLAWLLALFALADFKYNFADAAGSPFVALLLGVYGAGAYGDRRRVPVAIALLLTFLVGSLATSSEPVGDFFFIGGIMFAVFGAATVVRSRQELADALAARTVELEHEREEKARLAVAEERARIARELHDVVAHNLSVIVLQAGAERRAMGDERPETAEVLDTIERTGRTAMAEMRRLLGMLRRSDDELALAPQPSLAYLDDLVEQVRDAGMPVELHVEGEPRTLAPGVDLSAYRIVQEALTNALKHAGPARARVTVRYDRDHLDIEIADDGAGEAAESPAGGHGLVGMRERVALFGGDLATGRRREGGYAVRARLPLVGGGA